MSTVLTRGPSTSLNGTKCATYTTPRSCTETHQTTIVTALSFTEEIITFGMYC